MNLDFEELLSRICNEDGFTVNWNGDEPTSGYVVSVGNFETTIPLSDIRASDIAQFAVEHENMLDTAYLGAWVSDNVVYLDMSDVMDDLDTAIKLGYRWNQKAIWDITGNKEIRL